GEAPTRRGDVRVAARNAGERARDVAAPKGGFGGPGIRQRPIGGDGHERVELGVQLLDAIEMGPRQLDRRQRPAPEARADVADGRVEELLTGHDRLATGRYRTYRRARAFGWPANPSRGSAGARRSGAGARPRAGSRRSRLGPPSCGRGALPAS